MISCNVAKSIKIIVNLWQFCLTEILLTVYNSRIISMSTVLLYYQGLYLLYSHITTSSPPEKAVQIITKSPPCAHSYPLFKTLHILAIFKIYKQQNFSPSLSPFFSIFISDFNKYSIRQNNNLHIHSHRITFLSLPYSLTT